MLILIVGFSFVGWSQTEIVLSHEKVVIIGENVYLKDVAEIKGDLKEALSYVRIISSPPPGGIRRIEKKYIQLRLLQLGFSKTDPVILGPNVVTIERAYQKISFDLINTLVQERVKDIIPSWAKRYQIIVNVPRFSNTAPLGDVDIFLELPQSDKIRTKTISLPVTININGKKWKRIYAMVKVLLYADLPIATNTIKKGEKISKESYKIEEGMVERLSFPYISPEKIVGYVALKNIYPGTIIDLTYISRPYQVKRGEIVEVVLRRGAITITLKAQALENGNYGDMIQLKNLKSGKKFTGIVQDYGLVIVK